MNCTKCNGKTRVYNSRPNPKSIRRHRFCIKCGHRQVSTETWGEEKAQAPVPKLVPQTRPKKKKRPAPKRPQITIADTAHLTDDQLEKLVFSDHVRFDDDEL